MHIPVVDKNQKPLMPTTPSRARRWIRTGKATPFWKRGVFCVRLNVEPSDNEAQTVVVGIDPGSKKEALTVKSEAHTYINIQADAVTWVSEAIKTRREMRRGRRNRKCPHRADRQNRTRGGIPPSTKARWQWKLRLCNWLSKMFPISVYVVEDIRAGSRKNCRKWNASFSPLEVGKNWFYDQLGKLGRIETRQGWETKELRDALGLKKLSDKMSTKFNAHCVDSWVLANWFVGGHVKTDNESMLLVRPLRFHRRQLHKLQPAKGGIRKRDGGTRSLGLKRGSLVRHIKYGLSYIGGYRKTGISLHSITTGSRVCRSAKPEDCKFLTYASWMCIARSSLLLKQAVPCA